jgi:hypothetical protein
MMRVITTIVTFWIPYMAPTLIAWIRQRMGKPIVTSLTMIFMMNLFLGWTIVGWVLPLANAFNLNPVAWFVLCFAKVLPQGGPAGPAPQGTPDSPGAPAVCSMCQGAGTVACSSCGGRGSWYEAPQTAGGTAQLRTCPACVSSGRLRCSYCGGSGRAA